MDYYVGLDVSLQSCALCILMAKAKFISNQSDQGKLMALKSAF